MVAFAGALVLWGLIKISLSIDNLAETVREHGNGKQ